MVRQTNRNYMNLGEIEAFGYDWSAPPPLSPLPPLPALPSEPPRPTSPPLAMRNTRKIDFENGIDEWEQKSGQKSRFYPVSYECTMNTKKPAGKALFRSDWYRKVADSWQCSDHNMDFDAEIDSWTLRESFILAPGDITFLYTGGVVDFFWTQITLNNNNTRDTNIV